ncbi:RNA polymerase sigma factor [Nocardia speluncae]|nr:sigma factor-like helix-turn-helix DNA-binding protein [Nocardia speluncae]
MLPGSACPYRTGELTRDMLTAQGFEITLLPALTDVDQVDDVAAVAEMRAALAAAMTDLPDRSRIVLTLRDAEDYSSGEVCALLGITAVSQRVILHRARATVRSRLETYFTTTGEAYARR